jgi:hypothetical protein
MEQLQALGTKDPFFIVIGTKAAEAFKKNEPILAATLGRSSLRWAAARHYSATN